MEVFIFNTVLSKKESGKKSVSIKILLGLFLKMKIRMSYLPKNVKVGFLYQLKIQEKLLKMENGHIHLLWDLTEGMR